MILFFLVVKNPYDLRSQIRFWILPQKRTPRFFIGSYVIGNTEEIKLKGGGGVSSKHIAEIVRKVGNQIKVLQRHKNVIDVYVKMRL